MSSLRLSRRLIVCCDGTANDSDRNDPLTNVARISRCISAEDDRDGFFTQIVFYMSGVGTGTSRLNNTYDGIIGRGIGHDIRQAYSFICNNFVKDAGDQIVLIGFSRGAFTARAVAQLIDDVGVLTKKGLYHLPEVYKLWKRQSAEDIASLNHATSKKASEPVQGKPSVDLMKLKGPLGRRCLELEGDLLLQREVQITACAVWDTVAALGPRMLHGIPQPSVRKLAFVNSKLCPNIELALHALALDEDRRHFKPLLWHLSRKNTQEIATLEELSTQRIGNSETRVEHPNVLKQCWFRGTHSDVGGGHQDNGLASISLAWMIAQLEGVVGFNNDILADITTYDSKLKNIISETPGDNQAYLFTVRLPLNYIRANQVTIQNTASSKLQGYGGGWHVRTPGEYFVRLQLENHGNVERLHAETIHYSVYILYSKGVVADCLGARRLRRLQGPSPQIYQSIDDKIHWLYLSEEEPTNTEAQLLATWTARKLLNSLLPKFVDRKVRLSNQNEVVPIFAVLHNPEAWRVAPKPDILPQSNRKKPKRQSRIENGAAVVSENQKDDGNDQSETSGYVKLFIQGNVTVEEPTGEVSRQNVDMVTMFKLDANWNNNWISRMLGDGKYMEYLVGDIAVPFARTDGQNLARPEQFSAIDPNREVGALRRVESESYTGKGKGREGEIYVEVPRVDKPGPSSKVM